MSLLKTMFIIVYDYKIIKLDSVTVNRDPSSDKELAFKKYIDDELDKKNSILIFNQTVENFLNVSANNDVYNLTKNDKIHFTGTTNKKPPNIDIGGFLLQI